MKRNAAESVRRKRRHELAGQLVKILETSLKIVSAMNWGCGELQWRAVSGGPSVWSLETYPALSPTQLAVAPWHSFGLQSDNHRQHVREKGLGRSNPTLPNLSLCNPTL
jgi:hypothetical protein